MEDEKKMTSKVNDILGINDEEYPNKNIKIEKKEKGLYERAENSVILITEDNKLILND